MKKSMIFGIVAIAIIGNLVFSDMVCAINVKKEVAKALKLNNEGKKAESKKKMDELMAEVDRLDKEGKKEEAKQLYKEIWHEVSVQNKEYKQKKKQ